jgi:hypothetical protein
MQQPQEGQSYETYLTESSAEAVTNICLSRKVWAINVLKAIIKQGNLFICHRERSLKLHFQVALPGHAGWPLQLGCQFKWLQQVHEAKELLIFSWLASSIQVAYFQWIGDLC